MKALLVLLMLFSTTIFGGILDEDNYWAHTFTATSGDYTYSEYLVVRTYKDATYKIFHDRVEVEKGTLRKIAYEMYLMTSSDGIQVVLQTDGAFSIIIRMFTSKKTFIIALL